MFNFPNVSYPAAFDERTWERLRPRPAKISDDYENQQIRQRAQTILDHYQMLMNYALANDTVRPHYSPRPFLLLIVDRPYRRLVLTFEKWL